MKTHFYLLLFQDKKGNELKREIIQNFSIKQVRKLAERKLAESIINDLFKIQVSKIY